MMTRPLPGHALLEALLTRVVLVTMDKVASPEEAMEVQRQGMRKATQEPGEPKPGSREHRGGSQRMGEALGHLQEQQGRKLVD